MVLVAMPTGFPYSKNRHLTRTPLSKALLVKVDYLGFSLLLVACKLLIVALEESGIQYAWSSSFTISFLVVSGVLWIVFLVWERAISDDSRSQEPVFT